MFNVSDAKSHLLFTTNIGRQLTARPRDHSNDWVLEGDLVGNVPLGTLKNQVLIGYNHGRDDNYSLLRRRNIPGIDYKNPNYNTAAPDLGTIPIQSSVDSERKNTSFFAQDQLSLPGDQVKVLAGFRYEKLHAWSANRGVAQPATRDGVFAPRAGLLYQPSRRLSFYGVFSSSEAPQRVTRPDGSVIDDPIEGDTREIGLKTYLFDGRVGLTFSWFNIERKNIANGATINGVDTILASGLEEARGFELEAAGFLSAGWQVVFNGSTARTSDHSTFLANPGSDMGGATDLKLALWSTYRLSPNEARGWEIGGGWIFQSKMHGEDALYVLPASHVFEARLAYAWKRCKVALNVENVFDERWFIDAPTDRLALPGTPRRARMTFSTQW
jgi:iron complex outermembrane receptor protein